MKQIILLIFTAILFSCNAQKSLITSNTKVDWKDYSFLYEDSTKSQFKPKIKFYENIEFHQIKYKSDNLSIQAFAAIPKKEGKYPVIIFNRGGNRDYGALKMFKGKYKYPAGYYFSKLANEGYIVIGCNYRGSGESEGKDEFGGKDINDVLNLIKVAKELPKADETKIGMYGWSRGGMMTYLALTKTDEIKAAIVGSAPSDKTIIDRPNMEKNVYAELIPNYWKNKDEELKKRSAIYFAHKFPKNVPILMLHGSADTRVNSSNSSKLALELDKFKIPYRLKIYKGGTHGLGRYRNEVDEEVLNWFNRYLKNDKTIPNN